jgi:hypothetical protein
MLSTSAIILEYVCPGLGVLVGTYMFMAPLKDCYEAVKAGKGLGDLNPAPWSFCTGNCIGVCAPRLVSFCVISAVRAHAAFHCSRVCRFA